MDAIPRRARPLPVQAGGAEAILLAADVNLLIGGVARLAEEMRRSHQPGPGTTGEVQALAAELDALQDDLANACSAFADPPLQVDGVRAALLRRVLEQRGAQSAGLRELERILRGA